MVADPDWFLDRIDWEAGTAVFVHSSRDRLSATLFLDGRTSFAGGEPTAVELDALIEAAPATADRGRFLFHMSFCGSTQLAHLIEASGAATVLKEPHALVDLADWDRSLVERNQREDRIASVLEAATGVLSRRWEGAGPTVIKPSNWVNNLLPRFPQGGRDLRAVMITIDRRAFLRAAFRGGRDRLGFTARAAAHFAAALGETPRLTEAVAGVDDPLDQAARLVLLAHLYQTRLFAAAARGDTGQLAYLEYETILADPRTALEQALAALDLTASYAGIEAALTTRAKRDAKNPDRQFSVASQGEEDRLVEQHHAARFDRALEWADRI